MTTGTGWSGRRIVPGNWKSLRGKVLRRDDNRCACGAPAVQVDHIVSMAEGGTHDLTNLVAICKPCHDEKTKAESARGRARAQASRTQREPHPGIIR